MSNIKKVNNISINNINSINNIIGKISSSVKLLLKFNGSDGDTSTEDSSDSDHAITFYGTAQLDTAQKKFGSSSLLLDGNSDYLSISDSSDWDVVGSTTDTFIIDAFIYLNNIDKEQVICGQYEGGSNQWEFKINSSNQLTFRHFRDTSLQLLIEGGKLFASQWYHVAFVKINDKIGLYIDGEQVGYNLLQHTKTLSSSLIIGRDNQSENAYFDGNIDFLRIDKSNVFSVSPSATLRRHYKLNDNEANTTVEDTSVNEEDGTATDNTSLLSTTGKINNCLQFNGSNEHVTLDSKILFDYWSPMTISFWIYTEGFSGDYQYPTILQLKTNHDSGLKFLLSEDAPYNGLSIGGYTSQMPEKKSTTEGSYFLNSWVHIVLVFDGLNISNINSYTLYIDNSVEEWTETGGWSEPTNNSWIGKGDISTNNFKGKIDDLRIYNGALTSSEISELYNSGNGTESELPNTETFTEPSSEYIQDIKSISTISNI